jgi:hypothetical protein
MEAVKAGIRGREKEVLAYYRALLSPRALLGAKPLFGRVRVPAIHVHGEDDGCIGVESAEGAERFHDRSLFRCLRIAPRSFAERGHFLIRAHGECRSARGRDVLL